MANPLKSFVSVEERSDGVYISVTREVSSSVNVDAVLGALRDANVLNFDAGRISEVVKRGRTAFEKIGPPFEYYNPVLEKYVDVSMAPMRASVKVSSMSITDNCKPTVAALMRCLDRKGVKFGIKMEAVSGIAEARTMIRMSSSPMARTPWPGRTRLSTWKSISTTISSRRKKTTER